MKKIFGKRLKELRIKNIELQADLIHFWTEYGVNQEYISKQNNNQ